RFVITFSFLLQAQLTPEEFRKRRPNWSLETDGQLLQYMVSIAKNVESLAAQTRDNLNDLMLTVKQSELKLANATNQFSAVEQVKFVENRVEEDDESFYGLRRRRQQIDEPRPDTTPDPGDERTLDDLIQLAVERSAEGMYRTYEKYPLPYSDSSDDEYASSVKGTVMHLPPSFDRPLPHVIGSHEWQTSWHVGLDQCENEYDSEQKEEYSESPSETDDGGMFPSQPNSKQHTPSESESSIWGVEGRKRAPSLDPSITGDDGSSIYSFASSSKVLPVRGLPVDISARLKPPSLFPEEPPEEEAGRRKGGDFGLFDNSPDEDEPAMPTPTPQPRQTVPANDTKQSFFKGNAQQPARKIVNLFDDEPPEPVSDASVVPEQRKTINLFIESEEDEDVVRENNVRNNNPASMAVKNRTGSAGVTNPKQMTKLVDELNNNFRKQQQEQIVPAARPPLVVNNNNKQRPATVTNLFDDEPPVDEFDQLFQAANPSAKSTTVHSSLPPSKEKMVINLFAEDDEDDYGGIVVGSNETKSHKSPLQGTAQNSPAHGLPLPKPAERPKPSFKKKSIFDDSESEEDNANEAALFGSSAKLTVPIVPTIPKAVPKVKKSIFSDSSEAEDDDDDEALFGKSSSILKSKLDALKRNGPAGGKNGNVTPGKSTDDDVLKPPVASALALDKDKKTVPKVSLFDDEPPSDDEDALFGQNATANRVQDTQKGKVSLFEPHSTLNDQPSDSDARKQSLEPVKYQTVVKEAPSSIRSMIMKKSIFNSDSESDEEDSIFETVPKAAGNGPLSTNKPETNVALEGVWNVEEDTKTTGKQQSVMTDASSSYAQNASQSIISIEKEGASPVLTSSEPTVDSAIASKNFLLEESKSEHEGDKEPQRCDELENSGPTLESVKRVSEENASNELIVDKPPLDVEKPEAPESDLEDKPLPDKPVPGMMMIANDIDYYLHMNETTSQAELTPTTPLVEPPAITPPAVSKSEPKSALNFSPIGLFDDVPPPDDGDETDDTTTRNDLQRDLLNAVESGEPTLPPIEDEPSPYSTETQSLNFIPTGQAGNIRSRYLFDDEPPPDEADNSRAGSKGLFDNPAPVSLPPVVEDIRPDSVKPNRPKINKLNTKIAINVAALLPGARRTTGVTNTSSPEKVPTSVLSVVKSSQSGDVPSSEKLTGLNKGRARIPTKRKPPSRQNLRAGTVSSSLQSSTSSKSIEDDDRIVVGSEGKIEHVEASLSPVGFDPPQNRPEDLPFDRLSASVRNPTKRLATLPDGNEGANKPLPIVPERKTAVKSLTKSIFDDSDSNDEDDDDLFKQLPTAKGVVAVKKPAAPVQDTSTKQHQQSQKSVITRSIFGSNDEDDDDADDDDGGENDLFGAVKKSSIVGKLTGAKTEKKGLFDDDDGDSDDDLFGSKSKTVAKAQSHLQQQQQQQQQQEDKKKQANRSLPPTITKPVTTTIRTGGDDPLADLLADS
ncbi:WASH complex subunit 2, partial [Anopheles maculipalpis]|uniref:WASH complex subunit 2 n=1 Tax=Anopheles maculipalpis TaxID=1496333 RepID=UPI0021595B66